MSGKVKNENQENYNCYVRNLMKAAEFFQSKNILCVIEPINNDNIPEYYMNHIEKGSSRYLKCIVLLIHAPFVVCIKMFLLVFSALKVLKDVNHPNLKIMVDIFHMQKISGNISNTLKSIMPMVGHIQIAQVPDRSEPHNPGELNYEYLLKMIRENGYDDWIGLEYIPKNGTENGLRWIKDFHYEL